MICDLLTEFADGELDPPLAAAFRAHLADCRTCERELLTHVQLTAQLSDLGERESWWRRVLRWLTW